ncbi:MAG: hypothetical protein QOF70_7867 [Acetobacteraceae bacterium]|nr:hypothetical protein [Acetobacteraceae bacterium]
MDEHSIHLIKGPKIEVYSEDLLANVAAVGGIAALPKILSVVCKTTGMGFAAVARVTEDRWIACAVRDEIGIGLQSGSELPICATICNDIRASGEAVVISNVATDETYRHHPVPAIYGFQSYISMPIILPDGTFFGTLCAVDLKPARLDADIASTCAFFAELIGFHVDALDRMNSNETRLLAERKKADLREQFIAVVGHDLRNPLAAIGANIATLRLMLYEHRASRTIDRIEQSILRMSGLIEDMLDFARGTLGGGIILSNDVDAPLEPVLRQVIEELGAVWPDRILETQFAITEPVRCDHRRMSQLLSNILGNAMAYGAAHMPIQVRAITDGATFELSVSNAGDQIPPGTLERLFDPFFRGMVPSARQGLGLGLYIGSEIARAHGGTLEAASSPEATEFKFRMPLT